MWLCRTCRDEKFAGVNGAGFGISFALLWVPVLGKQRVGFYELGGG